MLIISLAGFAQDYDELMLVFNNKFPATKGYNLQDILKTDTLKTNNPDIIITGFICSSMCSIDWSVKHNSNILSSPAKKYIKYCTKNHGSLYFANITAITKEGKPVNLGSRIIRISRVDE